MTYKRIYNNLLDSILVSVILCITIAFYCIILWFGFLPRNWANSWFGFTVCTILFAPMIVGCCWLIIEKGYGYWYLTENTICTKKLFRRRIEIPLNEIVRVEKKKVNSLLFDYTTVCHILYSKDKQIVIYLKEGKHYTDLEHLFEGLIITE